MPPESERSRLNRLLASEPVLLERLRRLFADGDELANRLKTDEWSRFVPADYEVVLESLLKLRTQGGRFLDLGSGIGVVSIMADILGFDAHGIEIVPELVEESCQLAERHESKARFALGSFLPEDYRWVSKTGDTRLGAISVGVSAYPELGYELADFDIVYAYPWPGQAEVLRDLVHRAGAPHAKLLLHGAFGDGASS